MGEYGVLAKYLPIFEAGSFCTLPLKYLIQDWPEYFSVSAMQIIDNNITFCYHFKHKPIVKQNAQSKPLRVFTFSPVLNNCHEADLVFGPDLPHNKA